MQSNTCWTALTFRDVAQDCYMVSLWTLACWMRCVCVCVSGGGGRISLWFWEQFLPGEECLMNALFQCKWNSVDMGLGFFKRLPVFGKGDCWLFYLSSTLRVDNVRVPICPTAFLILCNIRLVRHKTAHFSRKGSCLTLHNRYVVWRKWYVPITSLGCVALHQPCTSCWTGGAAVILCEYFNFHRLLEQTIAGIN